MATIGYARVSSVGQSLGVQRSKLKDYDADIKLYAEKKSGANTNRPRLNAMLDYVRDGDKVVITKLDRLGRSVLDLTKIAAQLENKKVDLVVLDQQIDTSNPAGKMMFHMLAAVAEFENGIRRERQMDGIAKAKAEGRPLGRKPTIGDDVKRAVIKDVKAEKLSKQQIADKHGISRAKVYHIIGELIPV